MTTKRETKSLIDNRFDSRVIVLSCFFMPNSLVPPSQMQMFVHWRHFSLFSDILQTAGSSCSNVGILSSVCELNIVLLWIRQKKGLEETAMGTFDYFLNN